MRPGATPGERPDVLVAEIGSTITVVNAFSSVHPKFLARVCAHHRRARRRHIGPEAALEDLSRTPREYRPSLNTLMLRPKRGRGLS